MKKIKNYKKIIAPGAAITASLYISFIFATGGAIGYFLTDLFCKKFVYTGKVNLMVFNFKNWQLHLHHWLYGILIIAFLQFTGFFPTMPLFFLGGLSGLVVNDLLTDKSWYRVIYRKNKE